MITVTIPNNNIEERRYICSILFNEFLGIGFDVEYGSKDYEIKLDNGNILIIEDHFFNDFPKDLQYLDIANIPKTIKQTNDEEKTPIIYGHDTMRLYTKNVNYCICGIDIFASSFFMLTRWEEYVTKCRDMHGRFPGYESFAFKNNFLEIPVVDKYVDKLWQMLESLKIQQKRKKFERELFLTHDIDELFRWKNWIQVIRVATGDLLKRRNLGLAIERFLQYYHIKKGNILDPYDTFDYLMEVSESIGIKSQFYFMSGGQTKYDNRYAINDARVLSLIKKIKSRGHTIGIHPSYNAYNDSIQLHKEKTRLEEIIHEEVKEGREHYLRFEVPYTWQIWEDNNMEIDSTCGYSDKEGFRCGTGTEYSVFNILTREKLKLRERPLVVMDRSLFSYQSLTHDEASCKLDNLRKQANCLTILWHNSYLKHLKFYKDYIEASK